MGDIHLEFLGKKAEFELARTWQVHHEAGGRVEASQSESQKLVRGESLDNGKGQTTKYLANTSPPTHLHVFIIHEVFTAPKFSPQDVHSVSICLHWSTFPFES